jgi:hypothetical protein
MKPKLRWLGVVIIISTFLGWYPSFAQGDGTSSNEAIYYPQYGHSISKEFLTAYKSIPDPEEVYGYPITEAFEDRMLGRIVQYFENTRFELIPENPPELRVRITELGSYFYTTPGQELPLPDNFPACKTFQETGKQVCYAFLEYFDANGGAVQFGYPLSNFQTQDDLIVQYFQRARFEWHPELPAGERVSLTQLGYRYFYKIGEDSSRLNAIEWKIVNSPLLNPIISLRVRAFPLIAVVPQGGAQTIYVIVQSQNLSPIQGATVTLEIIYPSGKREQILVGGTNAAGFASYAFNFSGEPQGIVEVHATATFEEFVSDTVTSFRIWW